MRDHRVPDPRRHESSARVVSARVRAHDLRAALDRYEHRWSAAAVAAACTLPETTRDSVLGWASLLDRLDDAIRDVICG
jgi:hypothetical protein